MRIVKLDAATITTDQRTQMYGLELDCGLEPYTPEMLLDCVANLDTFACVDGSNIVGFLTMHSQGRYLGSSLYVVNINVARNHCNHGIAKRLLYTAYQYYLPAHQAEMITLDVDKTNTARALYRKIGFSELDIPSRNGESDVVMAMLLVEMGEQLCKLISTYI